MSFSFTGKAAIVAVIVAAVLLALTMQNPQIIGWLFSQLYTGPR